ncbi:MAG: molybdenum cofactor guanylyltransferase MobA [Chromatiales bacterium]|jgi:molybdopterin-guanine dinucleotide biosynthesis protein A
MSRNLASTTNLKNDDVTVLILAGGKSRRMGGRDKALLEIDGKPMIEHSLELFQSNFARILISANRNLQQYAAYGLPVLTDETEDAGPLAGLQAAMRRCDTPYLLVTPCDTPRIDLAISERLLAAAHASEAAILVAHDGERLQMLHALFNLNPRHQLLASLTDYLNQGERRVESWYRQQAFASVDCSAQASAFVNINTPDDLASLKS